MSFLTRDSLLAPRKVKELLLPDGETKAYVRDLTADRFGFLADQLQKVKGLEDLGRIADDSAAAEKVVKTVSGQRIDSLIRLALVGLCDATGAFMFGLEEIRESLPEISLTIPAAEAIAKEMAKLAGMEIKKKGA